jgi:hypothetical protein
LIKREFGLCDEILYVLKFKLSDFLGGMSLNDLPFCPKQPTFDEIDRNEEIIDDDKDEVKYNNFKKNHQP